MPSTTPPPDAAPAGDGYDRVIKEHQYDGIREYDNPMPAWWLWLLWGSVLFAVVYVLGIYVFGFVNTYEDDLAESLEELEMVRAAYQAERPAFEADEATLAQFAADPARIEAGGAAFTAQCASCHGNQGQGLIGPNMTDAYWIHGGSNVDIFNVISQGVLDKGMPPWSGVFSPEESAELVAYVRSLAGTNPPNAKAPEGELVE